MATNFTPLNGEIIIYDEDENYSYKRVKIGDGATLVSDLSFVTHSWNDLEDRPFGDDFTYLIPEGTMSDNSEADFNSVIVNLPSLDVIDVDSLIYTKINDVVYESKIDLIQEGVYGFGNYGLMTGGTNNGESYIGMIMDDDGVLQIGVILAYEETQSIPISVWQGEKIKKLDNKYIDAEWMATYKTEYKLIHETSLEFDEYGDIKLDVNETWMNDLADGQKVKVTFDGKDYECKVIKRFDESTQQTMMMWNRQKTDGYHLLRAIQRIQMNTEILQSITSTSHT